MTPVRPPSDPDIDPDAGFPAWLVLAPESRWPTTLPADTARTVLDNPVRTVPRAAATQEPHASVVLVTSDNLLFARLSLESLLLNTSPAAYEVIVVDNASRGRAAEYLKEMAARHAHVRLLVNAENRGFAPAANQGLACARGRVLVLLNDDTLVPPGWLERLSSHLDDRGIGLVGPRTNRAGTEAEIEAPYRTYGEFLGFTARRVKSSNSLAFDIPVATMFCTAMRRDVLARVGPLDEQFEVGLFEDDDYAMRARAAGYRVVCADDVFVHHFGQASLGRLADRGAYGLLFRRNRERWETKWRRPWRRSGPLRSDRYVALIERIREIVDRVVPAAATVLVVSRGDEELVRMDSRRVRHFLEDAAGGYAGYHPADSASAIEALERARRGGGDFLLFPNTSFWWLDYYGEFGRYLDVHGSRVWDDEYCVVYRFGSDAPSGGIESPAGGGS